MAEDSQKEIPVGTDFLNLIWGQEDDCERITDGRIPHLGEKVPGLMAAIGTGLSLLDRAASCWWGCRQGDHVIEYLSGRASSTARSALRLSRLGLYDEALVMCRSLGEIANLLCLFTKDSNSFSDWKNATRRDRLRLFGPFGVRKKIEDLGGTAPINEERYRLLSERGAHVHPQTTPQNHNVIGLPSIGANYQEAGLLVCLNETALPLCFCIIFSASLLSLDSQIVGEFGGAAKKIAENIGAANILEIDEYHNTIRASSEFQKILHEARETDNLRKSTSSESS